MPGKLTHTALGDAHCYRDLGLCFPAEEPTNDPPPLRFEPLDGSLQVRQTLLPDEVIVGEEDARMRRVGEIDPVAVVVLPAAVERVEHLPLHSVLREGPEEIALRWVEPTTDLDERQQPH